jgi:chromosome segregation ATPase
MRAKNRQQVVLMGLLLLLLAIVSTILVFTLMRQHGTATILPKGENETELHSPASDTHTITETATTLITPEAHDLVLAELEAVRMLAAEEKKRANEQQATLESLNERLQREDAARREAEKQAADLRARLDALTAEMAELEVRREALAKERQRVEAEVKAEAKDPIVAAQVDAESQRLEQLMVRRDALEAEVAAAEKRQLKALEQQIGIEDEIIERGGALTIRAPHDRRRDAIRLRDQMRQQSTSE